MRAKSERNTMRKFARFVAGLVASLLVGAPQMSAAATTERTLGDRRYLLVAPESVSGAAPLVLALHGGFGSADGFLSRFDLSAAAARFGFRVAYLDGVGAGLRSNRGQTWNAGRCCGPAQRKGIRDVDFMDEVVAGLQREGLVTSVHLVGHSNGAMMIYRYLCEGRAQATSAVLISGSMMIDQCQRTQVRALLLHGAEDTNVPVAGGEGSGPSGAPYTSLAESGAALGAAGASVTTQILPGAAHRLDSIDRAVRQEVGVSLTEYTAEFLMDR
jgi:polyhydroxybutyrate depolymerase